MNQITPEINSKLDLLSSILKVNKVTFNGDSIITIEINNSTAYASTLKLLSTNSIQATDISSTEITIDLSISNLGIKIFYGKTYFLETVKIKDFEKAFAMFDDKGLYCCYDSSSKLISPELTDIKNADIQNSNYYLLTLELLKTIANYNHTNEFVILSFEKGEKKIEYKDGIPEFMKNLSLVAEYNLLATKVAEDNKEFISIFKNKIFELLHNISEDDFTYLIKHLKKLVELTDRDYTLFVRKFSFENFLNELAKQKQKYFTELNDITNKIASQAISLPISISVAAISVSQINSHYIKLLIVVCYLLYTIFYLLFEISFYKDVKNINEDFDKNIIKINKESGLNADEVSSYQRYFLNKFHFAKATIVILVALVIMSIFALLIYVYKIQIENVLSHLIDLYFIKFT